MRAQHYAFVEILQIQSSHGFYDYRVKSTFDDFSQGLLLI